jgi:hypothetical protein
MIFGVGLWRAAPFRGRVSHFAQASPIGSWWENTVTPQIGQISHPYFEPKPNM